MALTQAAEVEKRLIALHPDLQTEIIIIKTSGDWRPDQGETRLGEAEGGKGLFAKELEHALMENHIDIAVHSVKDMPSFLPDGLVMQHYLEREDSRDAFVSYKYNSFNDLPAGAKIGTSSVRRQAFLLLKRPDVKIVPFRGNVPTRLEKLKAGKVDATILSYAGLCRIDLEEEVNHVFHTHEIVPACGQGVVGIEYREGEAITKSLLDTIHHTDTGFMVEAERAALQVLDGSCHTPIGVHAKRTEKNMMTIQIIVARTDGTEFWHAKEGAPCETTQEAISLGQHTAMLVKKDVDPSVLS